MLLNTSLQSAVIQRCENTTMNVKRRDRIKMKLKEQSIENSLTNVRNAIDTLKKTYRHYFSANQLILRSRITFAEFQTLNQRSCSPQVIRFVATTLNNASGHETFEAEREWKKEKKVTATRPEREAKEGVGTKVQQSAVHAACINEQRKGCSSRCIRNAATLAQIEKLGGGGDEGNQGIWKKRYGVASYELTVTASLICDVSPPIPAFSILFIPICPLSLFPCSFALCLSLSLSLSLSRIPFLSHRLDLPPFDWLSKIQLDFTEQWSSFPPPLSSFLFAQWD